MPAKRETDQPLAPPFWPGHTAIFSSDPQAVNPSVRAGIPPLYALNEMGAPFRHDGGLLIWLDP